MSAVQVRYDAYGPAGAPAVVLSGSLGSTAAMWDAQRATLRAHLRVVTYDLRGHGGSPVPPGPYEIDDLADDLVALLDRLGLERAHLVGLSLGGMVSLRVAARDPSRVDRVAVLCTSALLGPPEHWAQRAAAVRLDGVASIAPTIVQRWFTEGRRRRDPALVAWAEAMVASTPVEGYASCCGAIERMDLRVDLPRVEAPLLAIAGAQDPSTPAPHLQVIADGVADGRLLVVEDAAHLANVEQPDVVDRALLDHLLGDG